MCNFLLDDTRYKALARMASAEGCVLLKNENDTLPLKVGEKVALFGRSLFNYYKSGLGSGGLVNNPYTVSVLDALKEEESIEINSEVLQTYEMWLEENPYDEGAGWGKVPWSQKEMPLDEELVKKASTQSDVALVFIGRTGGEDQDTKDEEGSYKLTALEEQMISRVTRHFPRTAVLFNTGNIMDMTWLDNCEPSALMYIWQGGQEGGNGVADILLGKINPSGKLTDTIARSAQDYPSSANFGDLKANIYSEDIYVGYRYFETFAKDKVLYPFGYGLSYTDFSLQFQLIVNTTDELKIRASVTNTGDLPGKEVVQIYCEAPQGKLGKASRVLVAYHKTEEIQPQGASSFDLSIPKFLLASYDDSDMTGHKSSFLLEQGTYILFGGNDVRSASEIDSFEEDFRVIETLEEACAPVQAFDRMKPVLADSGQYREGIESVPLRSIDLDKRMVEREPEEIPYRGDQKISFKDVFEEKVSLEEFISQLDNADLACLVRGEGMSSPKATPGVAAAFGGLTEKLSSLDVPVTCCADGPSGIRMDCGTKAFSLPNGTALGCSFNHMLVEDLFACLGQELRRNKIETILGPGINIHRNPLNGRNFEYISEDPLLTGKIAAAQLKGLHKSEVTGTIKHFVANNQEAGRSTSDSIVSERALREIYLKGFEIAVKDSSAYSVMTTYGAINGIWTAGNYDLCTTVLRNQWGFEGIVMTDWWAQMNFEGQEPSRTNTAAMVRAQNDLYMCVADSECNSSGDNILESLETGIIKRAHLTECAKNILGFAKKSLAMKHKMGMISQEELDAIKAVSDRSTESENLTYHRIQESGLTLPCKDMKTSGGHEELFGITVKSFGNYNLKIRYKCDFNPLAQMSMSIFLDNQLKGTMSLRGTEGQWREETISIGYIYGTNHFVKLFFPQTGIDLESMTFQLEK